MYIYTSAWPYITRLARERGVFRLCSSIVVIDEALQYIVLSRFLLLFLVGCEIYYKRSVFARNDDSIIVRR